jgi:hypothetical protein
VTVLVVVVEKTFVFDALDAFAGAAALVAALTADLQADLLALPGFEQS